MDLSHPFFYNNYEKNLGSIITINNQHSKINYIIENNNKKRVFSPVKP